MKYNHFNKVLWLNSRSIKPTRATILTKQNSYKVVKYSKYQRSPKICKKHMKVLKYFSCSQNKETKYCLLEIYSSKHGREPAQKLGQTKTKIKMKFK